MSQQLTLPAARVIDPVLTTLAQGYKDNDFVGDNLFPPVPVDLSGGQIIEFGKEDFMAYNTQRAPGARVGRVQFGYLGRPFALENHGLAGQLPVELARDAQAYPGIDMAKRGMRQPLKVLWRRKEIQQAALATNAANYDANHKITLAGTSKFSDPACLPITEVDAGREAIRSSTGMYPNVALFGPVAWNAFKNNPNVIDRIKYTQKGMVTEDLAAGLLSVDKVIVGKAVQSDAAGNFTDIWGNTLVLAYTALGSLGQEEPSYGYTYTMRGNPIAEQAYYDGETRSWVFPVFFERVAVLSGITAGYLFSAVA